MKLHSTLRLVAGVSGLVAGITAAQAADLSLPPQDYDPPVYHAPAPVKTVSHGGWYLRGDVGYSVNKFDHAEYITYGNGVANELGRLEGTLKNGYTIGGGVGYDTGNYLRADLTLDYMAKADFNGYTEGTCTVGGVAEACRSSDTSSFGAWTLLANAYVDLGTYGRITPYVGAGIGGAHVTWHDLDNTIDAQYDQAGTTTHEGHKEWRFAYAAMAGASIDVTCNTAIDVGYRYQRIQGGEMFKYAELNGFGVAPGFDEKLDSHQVRAGLRYKFGGDACGAPVVHPEPVHMVYK